MTSVSAGHIILTPTQPVGSGRPQRESNPGPPHQESRALPTELPRPSTYRRETIICKILDFCYAFAVSYHRVIVLYLQNFLLGHTEEKTFKLTLLEKVPL